MKNFRLISALQTFTFLCCLFASQQSSAQCPTLFVDDLFGTPGYPTVDDLSVCGKPDTLSLYVLNTSGQTLLNSELVLHIPSGMQYAGCAEAYDPAYNILEGDVSDPQCPTFIFENIGADSVQIVTICVIANCDVYANSPTQQYFFDADFNFLFLEEGNTKPIQCMAVMDGKTDYSPYVKRPTINIINQSAQSVTITNSSPRCNNVRVSQTGIDASVAGFNFTIDGLDLNNFGLAEFTIGGVDIPYTYDAGAMLLSSFVDASFLPGGSLGEDEFVDVRICYDAPLVCGTDQTPLNVTYGASFGCSPDEPPCVAPSTADGNIKYAPNFGANPIVDITQVAAPGICGSNAIFDAVITSANSDPVLGLWEEVKIGFQVCEGDVFAAEDVKINGVSLPAGSFYYENFDFVVDATMFTFDPDGPGVGFEDLDGDGIFDEVPGGNTVTMTIELSVKCQDPAAIAGCASIDCEFSQATVSGLRHCGQSFQSTPNIDPAPSFSYGSEYITIDEGDISTAQNGSLLGYDFMNSTGSNDGNISTNTVEMEFCYKYLAEGIDACSAAGDDPYFEIAVDGPPIVIKDMVINNSSVTFNGAGVPSGNVSTAFNMDSSGVVFKILAGSNDETIDQCYKWTLELDSCICYPRQLFAASMRVVETCSDCMGPDGNDCTLVRACESTILASRRSCMCICPMSSKVVEQRRVEFGYTDKSLATAHDESTVNTIDWNRYLPCDSVYMHVEYEILDPLAMNDLDEIYFRIYNYALGGGGSWAGRPAWELEPDMHNSKMVDFAYEKVGSGVENTIDFTGCNTDNRSLYYRNINDGYFDAQSFLPRGVIDGVSTYNSTWDVIDNREFNFGIHDRGRQVSEGGAAHGIDGNCWEYLREDLMGGLQKGDKFHLKVKIPLQKNPYRQLLPEAQAIAPPVVAFHPNAYWYKYAGGRSIYVGGTCTTPTTIETHCPGPIVSETEYNVTDCDATVEHSFVMTNTPDDWYVGEWRPDILEFDTLLVPIPSPMVYAGNPRIMMADGTIIPLSDPTFDSNTFCAFDASDGQTKCTSISGGTGYMAFDVSEIPNFGVGLGGVECSFKLLYDLERICPGPISSPEDFAIYYDYSQTCDYTPTSHYCNRTNHPTRNDLSFFGVNGDNGGINYNQDLPCNPRPMFSDRDYHIVEDTSFTLEFNNMANPLPPLISSIESGLLADAAGASEFNTYEVCAGPGAIPHENVMTTIFLEPTVDLIDVTDNMGASVTYTLTNQSALGNTYLIAHANDLAPGDCVEYIIETELKICPYPGVGTMVNVKTTSSCLDLDFASQLFGVGGDACTSTGQAYEYVAGESEVQAAWDPQMNPVPLCGIADHSVEVKNTKDATLKDLEFNFNYPAGLIVIPGTFEYQYPDGIGPWVSIPDPVANGSNAFGTVYTLTDDVMTADINPNGLPGILDPAPNANRLRIRFQSRTGCDEYVSNTPLYFETTAATPCEERISSGFTKNEGVLVDNAIPAENAQFLIVADPIDYSCGGPVPLTVAGTNLSQTGGETIMSEACFKFPMELAYTPGSFVFNTPSSWTPTYVNETPLPGGFIELCFDLPDGIKPFEAFSFSAEITPDPEAGCEELLMGTSVKSVIEAQTCVGDDNTAGTADDSTCDVFVNNSINDQIVVNIKPPVDVSEIEMVVKCDEDPTMATFDYTLTLEATTVDYVGPVTVDFYRDLNLNGVLDIGVDPLMDTQMHNINVTAGTPSTTMGTTTVLEDFSCPMLLDLSYDVDCECNSGSYLYEGPPTPEFADFDGPISLCPGDDFMIDICSGYDFELANPASGVLTETATELTLAINDGFGVNSPVVLTVTNSSSTCPGEFEIEIFQLETFEIGPFPTVDACDMDCTELTLPGIPDDWKETMTVTWSPDTYLDDATSWEPEICNPAADIDYTVTVFNPNTGCTASAMYSINVIETTPPTLTYDGFDECYFAYDPAKIIAEPAGLVNYAFYFEDPAGDILLQSSAVNEFTLPFAEGDFYVIVDDGQCMIPSAPISVNLKNCVFDLALKKTLSATQVVPVYLNDIVVFDIEVTNQGTEAAQDIQVTDHIPPGFILMDPNWFSVSATEANISVTGPLLGGESTTISIMLKVTDVAMAGTAINVAEISSADDINSEGYPDIDSDEDNDPDNDAGGTPDVAGEDNNIDDDGTVDEDDHDPATVPVAIFDLALTKMLSPTQTVPVTVGSTVTYDIEVCNQGTADAYNIEVVDYVPAGMMISDATWTASGTPDEFFKTIAGPITMGNCETITLTTTVVSLPVAPATGYTNNSEINSAEDANGNNPPDIDSTPDNDPSNDGAVTDDETGNANGDEDDHDPATIPVIMVQCMISSNADVCPGTPLVLTEIGAGNVSWNWEGPGGTTGTTQTITVDPAIAGTYMVTVTDNNGFTSVCDVEAGIYPDMTLSGVETNVSCSGEADGAVDLSINGGTAPFTFDWSNDGPEDPDNDTEDVSGLAAGDYTVTVEDANGCIMMATFTITEPTMLSCTSVGTDLLCNGDNSGTITVTGAGGTTPYTYSVDGGAFQSGATFSGLAAGMHAVITKDANGCESNCDVMITEPAVLSCTVNATDDTSCTDDNGSVEVIAVGGTVDYMYSMDGTTFQPMGIFTGLGEGSYTLTVQDGNGCTTTCTAVLTGPTLPFCAITAHTDISCNGASDGMIVADGSLGSGTYEYSLDGAAWQSSGTYNDLTAGTYVVTVRNADTPTCTSECSITLVEPTALSCTTTGMPVSCNGESDGSITAAGTGGDGNYDYSIDGVTFQSNADFTGLAAGMYTVIVRDNGDDECVTSCDFLITEPDALSCSIASTPVLCNGDATGTVTVTAVGGSTPFNYSLDGAAYQPGNEFQGIAAGPHTVTVQDKNGCITMCTITITEPTVLECTTTATDATDCNIEDGTITVTATGGVGPYEYSIEDGSYQASNTFTGLMAGTHIVSTKDANGCVTTCEAFINAPNTPMCQIVDVVHVACFGESTGSVTVTGSGGNPPYEFSIDELTWQSTGLFENLPAGMHAIYIRNNTSPMCTSMCAVEIEQPEELTCLLTPNDPLCNGGADGNITTIATEGTMPYEYSVNGGAWQPGHVFMGLTAGPYTVTIRDGNGCLKTCDVTLGEPPLLECTTVVVDLLCNADGTGEITVSGTGGVPAYDYNLDGGFWQDSPEFTGLSGGMYTVNIRDENDCVSTCMATVNEPPALECNLVELVPESCAFNDGSIEVNATGGTAPVTYSIDGGTTTQATGLFTGLTLGTFTITITDANGCVETCDFEVLPDCFDLALTKQLVTPGPYSYGMKVIFDINVINQGNINATNVEVTDHIPCGFMYDPSSLLNLSNDWTLFSTAFPMTTLASLPAQTTTTVQIELVVQECTDAGGHTNVSEISQAFDEDGNPGDDVDSDPDFDPNNDNGGEPNGDTDDQTDGDGTDDEDDHDPALVPIYDLAMTKMLVTPEPYAYGDVLEFAIEVCNQAANPVQNIEIADYVPVGYSYDASLNAGWIGSGPTPTTLTYTYTTPLLAGAECVTIPLFLTLEMAGGTDDWKNVSEIASFEDEDGMEQDDVDSTPDDNPDNDGDMTDDATDGTDGDEDDSDFAGPEVVDAALVKTTTAVGPFSYGDMVTFDFEISNQGNVDLYNVKVNDFVPCGYNYLPSNSPLWIFDSGSSIAMTTIAGPIAPGMSETLSITLEVQACPGSAADAWTNVAEIESFENEDGDDITDDDVDSDGDDDPTNDDTEDNVDDNTNGDEDDNDPETIEVFDLAQIKTVVTPTPYGYGDLLEYSIAVTNQGNVTAQNITVTDNLPAGFSFDPADNPGWDATNAPAYTYTYAGPLVAGETVSIPFFVTIEMTTGGMDNYTNISEISSAEDDEGNPGEDADSDPDSDPDNDGDPVDDATEDPDDEDDHDPEVITVVDLALVKTTTYTDPIKYGDVIPFTIEVLNQGNVDAYNVEVIDYFPCGYEYSAMNNPEWSFTAPTGGPGVLFPEAGYATTTIAGPITAGTSATLTIYMIVQPCDAPPADYTNTAEITSMEDEDGNDISDDDIDSTADDDPDNDDETDDVTDGTDGDEDDADPATPMIFDLALTKSLATGQATPVSLGDDVTFVITVYNQGNITAANVDVIDYLPAGFALSANDTNGWTDADADGNPENTIAGPIAPNGDVTIEIVVEVLAAMSADDYINVAEITGSEDDMGNDTSDDDIDSMSDDNEYNDGGDGLGSDDDDATDGNGQDGNDEDDQDPATVPVQYFDLALTKNLAPGQAQQVMPGADVTFIITVVNQGTIDAYNVDIVDYLPADLTLSAADTNGWVDANGDGNPENTIAGPIAGFGGVATIEIVVTVNPDLVAPAMLTNVAEISDAEDEDGDSQDDVDSNADDDDSNDPFGDDNQTDGDGTDDEDDSDPAVIEITDEEIFDLALAKTLDPNQVTPVYVGDDITFFVTVTNQGTVTAQNIEISDYMGASLDYSNNDTNGWVDSDNDGVYENLIPGPVAPGQSVTVPIICTVIAAPTSADDLLNIAEITAAEDEDGNHPEDVDSTADTDPDNDSMNEDDNDETEEDGKDGGDEDDHDWEAVPFGSFDLALTKTLSPTQPMPIMPGDDVTFVIKVYNQGTVDAYNIDIVEYTPVGLSLSSADYNGWVDSDGDGHYENTINGIDVGECIEVEIVMTLDENATGSLTNYAEIGDAEDENGNHPVDDDSTPDDDPNNDVEGDDNQTDGDGTNDEDDHDPETITLGSWDLALTKQLAPGQTAYVMPGDDITFVIEVTNQGTMPAFNIDVVEYIPAGMTYSTSDTNGWTDADGDGIYENTIAGPLAPDASESILITLNIDDDFAGTNIENFAEISDFEDDMGNHPDDNDSDGDDDPNNDVHGDDNQTDGDGTDDEDDHDGEEVFLSTGDVYDVALDKELDPATMFPVFPGDDVTFLVTVTNQSNADIQNVQIIDYLSADLTLSTADANGWFDSDGDGNPELLINTTLTSGQQFVIPIVVTISPDFAGTSLENRAEITSFEDEDGNPQDDVDSTPDDNPDNDPENEDDEDGDIIPISNFDLALRKTVAPGGAPSPIMPGDDVTFRIEVHNQGNVPAYNVDVVEYVPTGMTLSVNDMNGWVDSDGDGVYENTIVGPVVPGNYDFIDVVLTVDPNITSPATLDNEAEIADAEDENGNHPEDSDSDSDDDPDNDGDPTDDDIDGTNGDEDDNDIESIDIFENMFDLALRKSISPEFEGGIQVGEDLPFDIWVYNQGNLTATNIEITEHMPVGSSVSVNDTNGWTDFDDDGSYEMTILGPLAPGDSVLVEIIVTLDEYNNTNELINYAEISGADDESGDPITDIDSNPDGDNTNDNGGDPYDETNDEINDDGTVDEDDHDPAVFQIVDVALLKSTTDEGPFSYGDQVTFDIEVANQGNVDLYNVVVNDFIPCGYTYLASNDVAWTYDAATSIATTTVAGPIARNGSVTVSITMEIKACETQGAWTNTAEISSMEDENGEDITDEDIDSNADNDPNNDSTEDGVDDNTNGDEDDNDPETIEVFDLALIKTVVTDPPYAFGQNITFELVLVNQGNVNATNVEITDHLPAGFVYNAVDNPGWDATTAPDYTYVVTDVLVMGDTVRVPFVAELQYVAGGLENYTNVGEISGAEDEMGGDRTDEDADSDADGDADNDNGGEPDGDTDDQFDGNGTDDEDDHDPALVPVIDVALVKTTSATGPFRYEESITFDIEVFNQGALDLYNVKVNDFIPCGYKYLPSNNGTWTFNPITEVATAVIAGPIVGQTSQTVSITLEISPCSSPGAYTNVAEIESIEDEDGTDVTDFDIDSQGDNDPTNDSTEDNTNDNTNGDEDDNDPESIEVFDLALIKELVTEPMYTEGDTIEFVVSVVNQGTITAANIQVADHLPIGYSYDVSLNPGWDDAAAPSYYYTIPGTLATNDTVRVSFYAVVEFVEQLQENYTNYAEISGATDSNGNAVVDADSDPDGNPDNDGMAVDNQFNDRGDEDDHDPESIDLTSEFIPSCSSDCEIQCIGQLNVSLSDSCTAVITPAMGGVGIDPACNDFYLTPDGSGLMIYDEYGTEIPDNTVGIEHIGQNITYQITEPTCGNKCWGNILVEYKLPPQIECPEDLTLTCAGADALGLPRATGGCLGLTFDVRLIDEVTQRLDCDPDFTQMITRTYRAEDELGNFIECSHDILVQRVDLTQVIFPDNAIISCADTAFQFLPNGAPVPFISSAFPTGSGSAGVPIVCDPGLTSGLTCPTAMTGSGSFAAPLIPIGGATMLDSLGNIVLVQGDANQLCNSAIVYTDVEIPSTGCKRKFLRTFEVREWWCSGENTVGDIQQIEVIDDVAPEITCPLDFTVTTDDDCAGSVALPAIDATDNCGNNGVIVSVDYPLGFLNSNGGDAVLEVGNNQIRYIVADSCYNDTTCMINVLVQDRTEPVAICESFTVVSISQSGNTFLLAESLDDGSWDECGLDRFEVARMDSSCVAQDTLFDDRVAFCCSDAGNEVMVIFRAIDKGGNQNDCMVRVEVQDKQVPLVTCPPNDTIDCRVPYDLNNLTATFGGPNLTDNCPSTQNIVEDITADINQCGIGTIFRKLNLLDTDNVTILRQCVQTITITNDTPFVLSNIQWPLDIDTTGACMITDLRPEDLPAPFGYPTFLGGDDACSLLGYDYEDKVFEATIGSGECAYIERTWTVINWCDQSTGSFTQFTDPNGPQKITLTNNVAPVIATQGPVVIESGNVDCESGTISITRTATDDCPNALDWSYVIRDDNGLTVGTGNTATLTDTLTAGNYTITWRVNDFCGNFDVDVQDLDVINTKTPTPVCINGLSGQVVAWDSNGDGMIDANSFDLWAVDIDGGSFHTCDNDIVLSLSPDTTITSIRYTCDSLGIRAVRLYVTDVVTGMQDYCSTFIDIQPNNNCTGLGMLVSVEGEVYTEDIEKVEEVEVELGIEGIMDVTEDDGIYSFANMPMGGSYNIEPSKDIDYLNGVSTFDIIHIQRHILGAKKLDSEYKMIAADVDNSEDITAIDLIELRKLILGIYDELPNNASWRFVDSEHTFLDPTNPWAGDFPETYVINRLDTDMDIDFIGVKVGDVNGSVIANAQSQGVEKRSERGALVFNVEQDKSMNGDIHKALITSANYNAVSGWQGTIEFDAENVEILDIIGKSIKLNKDNYNATQKGEGWVTISYHSNTPQSVTSEEVLYEIVYRSKEAEAISELFTMSSRITRQEAYLGNDDIVDVRFSNEYNEQTEILAVSPNPWIDNATVEFYIPQDGNGRWEFYDVNGRILHTMKDIYKAGYNSMVIKRSDIQASGIVYAKLITDTHTTEYKMMLVD